LLRFLAFAVNYDESVLISTPNLDSADLRLFGPAWCHWQPRRNRFIFGVKSLRTLMRHCGFEERKFITFSHPSWQSKSRQNLGNGLPPPSNSAASDLTPVPSQSKVPDRPPSLEGDFLIGLFSRKL
jgi:hypothetical protein